MNKFSNMYSNLTQQASTFTHDVRNEVVSATLGTNEYTYSYDPIGNRTTSTQNSEAKSYISNPLNQYITIQQEEQTAAPTYDADGNMLSSPSGWSFTWNVENRLVSASRGGAVVHYTYDAFGRMISKQIIGAENKTITYTWDVFNIIKETENSNATYNIWGLDVDGTMQGAGGVGGLLAVAKSGSFYTPTYDANGNITEYVSVNGNIVAQYKYSAFGEIISQSGESFTHRFSTKPYCPTTGLIEYQFRKYDPALGRWLSRDPIEEAGGLNLYAFCENNGIVYYDVLGEKCCILIWNASYKKGQVGHMALDCENVVYISKYPDKNAKSRLLPTPPSFHEQNDDKEYGDPSTKICFNCVDEKKIKEWYEKNKTKDYFWGSASCIEAVFDALKYSLPQEEKPKCECTPWYYPFVYIVGDRLNRGEMNPEDYPFIVPESLVPQLKRFAKDCKRYECIKYNFVLKAYYL